METRVPYLLTALLLLVVSQSALCCITHSLWKEVPEELPAGYTVAKVSLGRCNTEGLHVKSTDPDFIVQGDGTVVTSHAITVPQSGTVFSILAEKPSGPLTLADVILPRKAKTVSDNKVLRRTKRRWRPLPFSFAENQKPPFPRDIEVIASDSSVNHTVYYTISGPGVTEYPVDVFSVNPSTGMLRVHKPVDREQFDHFTFEARALDKYTHVSTDDPLPITVNVDDENDNAPEFSGPMEFSVLEQCKPGTEVGKIIATDKDDPATIHTKIKYKLLQGNELFAIHPVSGVITARTSNLDREVQDRHFAVVEIRDMNGADNGLSQTGTAAITLRDINDNPPVFSQTSYNAKIQENSANVLVLEIPVTDKDLINTDNWRAQYVITEGNETGMFRIETDPKTNKGLLYVTKPLDYEKTKNVNLRVSARNIANLEGTSATWPSVPVNLTVTDVDEGPEFIPDNLFLIIKENLPNGTIIGTYKAKDPETNSSKGVRYHKLSDPASWFEVMENSGDLVIANSVDRESSFVNNGLYNITVKAVDESKKTGTGTVVIKIEDVNDNTPQVTNRDAFICEGKDLGSVQVKAEDRDQHPFSSPFSFELTDESAGKWRLRDAQDTSVVLEPVRELARGVYNVPLMVKDLQGEGNAQMVAVRICQCRSGQCVASRSSAALGVWGVLAMLLGLLLLLLLLCILFMFVCSSKKTMHTFDDASGGILLKSNTEGPGDEVNLVLAPPTFADGSLKVTGMNRQESRFGSQGGVNMGTLVGQQSINTNMYHTSGSNILITDSHSKFGTGLYGAGVTADADLLDYTRQSSFLHTWNTNGLYLEKKLEYFAMEDGGRYADDLVLSYGYEGAGSTAGSVGCCSELGKDDKLDFLNSMGPKFKTLAEVCSKK